MKKGFTLVELIAVVILIAAISVLGITLINKNVNRKKAEISDAMMKIINSSAEVYMSYNPSNYKKTNGNIYCIKLSTLVELEILQSPIQDPVTKNNIDENKYVKVEVNNSQYKYNIEDECTEKR